MFRGLLITVLLATAAAGETPLEKTLHSAAARFHLTPAEIQTAAQKAVWNEPKNAAAIALPRAKGVLAIVLLQQPDGEFLAVDVSQVESRNLGKLSFKGRRAYERVETTPLEWLPRNDGSFQIVFRTRAWSGGQRYTVTEPLIIASDGRVFWR